MAARLNPKHDETTRAKIQTSQLINRLMAHVNSKKGLLTSSQVNAAKVLLSKTLPDLQAVQMQGELKVNPFQALLDEVDGRSKAIPSSQG